MILDNKGNLENKMNLDNKYRTAVLETYVKVCQRK
jgi:hypothetical protein